MGDHNDPTAVNSIFSDVDVSAADLYDLFGWPSDDKSGGEKAVVALTFAAVPKAGTLDSNLLYRIQIHPAPRIEWQPANGHTLEGLLGYADSIKEKYPGNLKTSEIRVHVDQEQRAVVRFFDFPGAGSFSTVFETNKVHEVPTPDGHTLKIFIGGRDDAFFNDLTGFLRSINYAPQFYHVPHMMTDMRELPIPKTLLELEGNHLFITIPRNAAGPWCQEESSTGTLHLVWR